VLFGRAWDGVLALALESAPKILRCCGAIADAEFVGLRRCVSASILLWGVVMPDLSLDLELRAVAR